MSTVPTDAPTDRIDAMSAETPPTRLFEKKKGKAKFARIRIPIQIETLPAKPLKPDWIRMRASYSPHIAHLKSLLRTHQLHTVCEEASCPNLPECFSRGIATFMIMGDKCTRRCTFCDVGHGKPDPLNPDEPNQLAAAIQAMALRYVVITSVDRDDLKDGGARHFAACIQALRACSPDLKIEILVPDFRRRMEIALEILSAHPPDVFNHNVETVPRLYKTVRPGSDYLGSLTLIQQFKRRMPHLPTKSGLMLGLGETDDEIKAVLRDMRAYDCDRLTLGQYLQPTPYHAPVLRFASPETFSELRQYAETLGFTHIASGPLVRSSYHADKQDDGIQVC